MSQPIASAPYTAQRPATAFSALAIVAFIAAFIVPVAGIACGHIALKRIGRTGDRGRALAVWAAVLGYVFFVMGIFFAVYLGHEFSVAGTE